MRRNFTRAALLLACIALLLLTSHSHSAAQDDVDKMLQERLPREAFRMYSIVTRPHDGELKWQRIPWLRDLGQAIEIAKQENRPILIFASGDEPLEKC